MRRDRGIGHRCVYRHGGDAGGWDPTYAGQPDGPGFPGTDAVGVPARSGIEHAGGGHRVVPAIGHFHCTDVATGALRARLSPLIAASAGWSCRKYLIEQC